MRKETDMTVIGWDVGGAHLKAARLDGSRVADVFQLPTPLWLGLDRLDRALNEAAERLGPATIHAVTMTGELCDAFKSREEGVGYLSARLGRALGGSVQVYAGRGGWVPPDRTSAHADDIASANWHATAALVARKLGAALLVDMGSTTTDLVPVLGGAVAARGYADAERLATGELVYTGASRTPLMAIAKLVPLGGVWTPLMNEYFATAADAHRLLGRLERSADEDATADKRDKSAEATRARLARMVGADAADRTEVEWTGLAAFLAEAQLRALHDAAMLVLSAVRLPADAPVVGAGIGRFAAKEVARRLGRPYRAFSSTVETAPGLESASSDHAPAIAVALLAAAQDAP